VVTTLIEPYNYFMNITLEPDLMTAIIDHAKTTLPEEACGLVVIQPPHSMRFLPLPNALRSEIAYDIDPALLASTFRQLRESREELFAIFHSHPKGPAHPSKHDLERAFYPEVAHIIVSLADPERPQIRAFRIIEGEAFEIELHAIV
jgi:proteasome lid subunit RPN8/RPN11